jgi:protein-glutamine gamma-glutamyltransferase
MIQIAGKLLQETEMWESESVEGAIIKRMQAAKLIYSYQNLDGLLFELELRKNIINGAIEMRKGKAKFNIFKNARGNPQYWQLTQVGVFQLRRGAKPADAIRDIFVNSSLYTFECATAIVMIYYYALLKIIGDTTFNTIFQHLYLYSWHLAPDYKIYTFYGQHLLPGDVVYFDNPDVDPKKYWWRGQNVIDMGDGTFYGHGFGMRTKEEMIKLLNEKRKPGSKLSAYLTQLITRPSFRELARLRSKA